MAIRSTEVQVLAYYQAASGIGLLGPRGWHCEGAWGSGGLALFLSPLPIDRGPEGKRFHGHAIEAYHITSHGRFAPWNTWIAPFRPAMVRGIN